MVHDMTRGKLFPILVKFTIPLVLGNLLQLTYNAVDGIVVGQFVGATALAAVGTSNPLMTLIILFEQGICLGTGILIGMMYGAKQEARLKREVSTGFLAGAAFSVLMSALVMIFAPQILRLMQVEEVIIGEASVYLRVIGFGLLFNFIYNYFAGTLRAMGDAKSPLIFLAVSAALNICGDLFFVCTLHLGIMGAAVATVVSEALSGILCWIYVQKKIPILQLGRGWLVFDPSLFRLTLSYGMVSALQQSAVQIGKLGIQGIVNTMGVNATAAFSAVNRADDYAMVIEQNIAHAMTSVMAQNEGAGEEKRVRTVFRYGMLLEAAYGLFSGILFWCLAEPMMRLFTADAAVIELGTGYLRLIAFMYLLPAVTNGVQGYFRGIGDLKVTLLSTTVNMCTRVLAAALLVFAQGMGFLAIPWSYTVGWVCMMAVEIPFLVGKMRKK
ncbi:MAG: MATE family efflux transporter [Lachnospiraceae bacterium]|jgi:putative MATE family efflux protein|nr:MATE family efflux transporter [Lachnospiraceae bacterium]MCI1398743.1 MATE family efflux transporter [Lachnospiraceae bacterium]MCI1424386.1 MATE family efflux transporter [Lachnospiraceae bacterium]MCI1453199.1 MATE family efflux transporter [Lachnospiraceae bacterium]